MNLQHTAVMLWRSIHGDYKYTPKCAYLIRTQVLNDKIHELCIARFNSIPFPHNFSEYSGPLQQFGIEPSEINITRNMSKNGATACDNTIRINSIYRLDQIAIVCHLWAAALQR